MTYVQNKYLNNLIFHLLMREKQLTLTSMLILGCTVSKLHKLINSSEYIFEVVNQLHGRTMLPVFLKLLAVLLIYLITRYI